MQINPSKVSNEDNDVVVKKTVYYKLPIKANAIDAKVPGTSELVTKTYQEN